MTEHKISSSLDKFWSFTDVFFNRTLLPWLIPFGEPIYFHLARIAELAIHGFKKTKQFQKFYASNGNRGSGYFWYIFCYSQIFLKIHTENLEKRQNILENQRKLGREKINVLR